MQTQSYHQCWRRILRGRVCPTRIKRTINWEAVGQLLSNPSILVIIQQATRATNIVVNKTHQIDRWTRCLYQVCMSDAYFTVREYSAVGDLVYVVWGGSNCGVRVVNVGGSIASPASATSAPHMAIQALKRRVHANMRRIGTCTCIFAHREHLGWPDNTVLCQCCASW